MSSRDNLLEVVYVISDIFNFFFLEVLIVSVAIAYAFLVIIMTGIFRAALQLVYFLLHWLKMLVSRDMINILLETDAVYILNFPSADVWICSLNCNSRSLEERCPFLLKPVPTAVMILRAA